MVDIKTRNVVNGTIRTIDKASVASQRMKTSYAKTKQQAVESYSSDDNLVEYASGRMSETASRVLHKSSDGAATAGHQGAKAAQAAAVNLRKNAGEKQLKKSVYKGNVRDLTLRENGRAALARSRARAKARHDAEKKVTAKATKNVLKKIVISLARAARAAGEAIKASAAAIAAAGMCCGFFVLSPLRCKRHKNTLDVAKGYKNKSSPEVTTPKWNLWHQLCLLFKSILHDQAVSLSDCNGKFRSHHRSYEKYPCEQ